MSDIILQLRLNRMKRSPVTDEVEEVPSPKRSKHLELDNSQFNYSKWSDEEDDRLKHAVTLFGEFCWKTISDYVGTRDNMQCRQRWLRATKPGIIKGRWTTEEDELLKSAIKTHSTKWSTISELLPGRTANQCRERWCYHLCPKVNKSRFSDEEDQHLITLHKQFGNRWSKIAQEMNTGRTEAGIRSRYLSLTREQSISHNEQSSESEINERYQSQLHVINSFMFPSPDPRVKFNINMQHFLRQIEHENMVPAIHSFNNPYHPFPYTYRSGLQNFYS